MVSSSCFPRRLCVNINGKENFTSAVVNGAVRCELCMRVHVCGTEEKHHIVLPMVTSNANCNTLLWLLLALKCNIVNWRVCINIFVYNGILGNYTGKTSKTCCYTIIFLF